jgi:group I intron endonuclease
MKGQFIYKIVNTVNGKFYVGSTTNTRERFRVHRNRLRNNKHHSPHLQAAWNKYSESMFVFHVIETIPDGQSLQEAEDVWLLAHVGKPYCYNTSLYSDAPMRGRSGDRHPNFGKPLSEEMKQSISEGLKEHYSEYDHPRSGKTHSEETKNKISAKVQKALSEGRGGKFIPSDETRQKMSGALKGNQSAKGYKRTDAEREAIRQRTLGNQNWLGKKHTEASKEKMSKPVFVMPDGIMFPSLTSVLKKYDMKMPTLMRTLKSGKPISKGRMEGYSFSYGGLGVQITETDRALSGKKV